MRLGLHDRPAGPEFTPLSWILLPKSARGLLPNGRVTHCSYTPLRSV